MRTCASTHTAYTHAQANMTLYFVGQCFFTERPEKKKEKESETNTTAGILKQDQTTETALKKNAYCN